jgi:branched-chain amino acid transport system substrate-binding protein
VFFDALTPGERDYTAILTKLKGANPDVVLFTGYFPKRVCCCGRRRT